jgi:hypothetical protein
MRRLFGWVAVVGLLMSGLVLGTQVSTASQADAAVNGAWSALGGGLNGRVFVTFQADNTAPISGGNPLYVGGAFTNAGGDADADYLAKWDGSAWSKVATTAFTARGGVFLNYVASIAKSGNDLYVGGVFAVGASINIAKIDLTNGNVSGLGTGMSTGTEDSVVEEIAIIGSSIYAGGAFGSAGGVSNTGGIAVWDGTTWGALGVGLNTPRLVNGMGTVGTTLFVGGQFPSVINSGPTTVTSRAIASWSGTTWSAMNTDQRGFFQSPTNPLTAAILARSINEVFAAGRFTSTNDSVEADRVPLNGIAKWDGSEWSALGSGISGGNAVVETLALKDLAATVSASNPLYLGGDFTAAGGVTANNIAKWDGTSWDSLVCGPENGVRGGAVRGIVPQSDGTLIIAGGFTNAGGYSYIAKFTPGADNCTPLSNGPTEPRNVYAAWNYGTETVRISWDAPEFTGSLPIISYRAVSFDDNVYCWTSGFSCEISVTDVPDSARMADGTPAVQRFQKFIYLDQLVQHSGVPQGFYAQAGTSAGWGLKGWAPKPPGPTPPSAPANVKATPGRNSVTVTWSPSAVSVTRGLTHPVTNYLVQANPGGQVCITRLMDASFTTCTFATLTAGVDYTFTVQGLNGAGWGARSATSNEASPYDLRLVDAKAKKKLVLFREVSVVGTAPGYKAGQRVRLFWRQVGTSKWNTDKGQVATANGKRGQRYTFTVTLERKAFGKQFEFRLASGGESSNVSTIRIP